MDKIQQNIKMNKTTAREVTSARSGILALQLSLKKLEEAADDVHNTIKDLNDIHYFIEYEGKGTPCSIDKLRKTARDFIYDLKSSLGNLIVNPLDEEEDNAGQ